MRLLAHLTWVVAVALLIPGELRAQDLRTGIGNGDFAEDLKEAFDDLRRGKRERARLKFEEILLAGEEDEEPASPAERARATAGMALIDRETGNYEDALKKVVQARQLDKLPELDLLEARVRALMGQYEKAIENCKGILEQAKSGRSALDLETKVRSARWLARIGKNEAAKQRLLEVEDAGKRFSLQGPVVKLWYAEALVDLAGRDRLEEASAILIEVTKKDPLLARAFVTRGNLLFEVYRETRNFPSGESEYKRAIANCGEVEGALLGLYLSRKGNFLLADDKTEAYLERALELNPKSVPALCARASQLIDDRNFEAAYSVLREAIEINPRDTETLAELAAVSYLTYRGKEEDEYRKRAQQVSRNTVLVDLVLGEHLIALYRFEDALPFLFRSQGADAKNPETLLALGKALIRVGRTEEGAEFLETTKKLRPGFLNPWRENQLFLHNRIESDYEKVDAGNFLFVLHPTEKGVLFPYLKETYEEAWRSLGAKYGTFPACKVRVEDFERFGDFSVRTIGFKGFGALGACFGCLITSVSPAANELRSQFSWKVTAWHEFSHVLHLQLSKARVPRWLTEGLAVFEEMGLDPSFDRRMEKELYSALRNDGLIPLAKLNGAFRGSKIMFGYYQGGLIVRHLAREHGFQKVLELLKAYGEDKNTEQILREVLGTGTKEYDRKFHAFVEDLVGGYKLVPIVDERTMHRMRLRVAENPNDIDARLRLAEGYAQRQLYVDAGTQLAALRKLAPDNGTAYLIRARIARQRRDLSEARRLLRLGFENGGDDFGSRMFHASVLERVGRKREALVEYEKAIACWPTCPLPGPRSPFLAKMRLLREEGRKEEAAAMLEKYASLNGRDYSAQVALADHYRGKGETNLELKHLEKARDIDPFDRALHERLAGIYRQRGRFADAIRVLRIGLAILPEKDRKRRQPGQGPAAPRNEEAELVDRARLRLELAETLLEDGDREGARREARKVLDEGDRLPAGLRDRARSLVEGK